MKRLTADPASWLVKYDPFIAGGGAEMTFDEVPIGHVFKWLPTAGQLGCDCLVRRTGETSYVYVRRCPEHVGATATSGKATMSEVRYDPFLAMVEAVRDNCE